jgi:hypothetical protein
MSGYVTIKEEMIVFDGERIEIGQKRILVQDYIVNWRGKPELKAGDSFVIKNIIHTEEAPDYVYLACEFLRDINGHICKAHRRGHPRWPQRYLCADGRGGWFPLKEAVNISRNVDAPPDWMV